jgi:hypothetical protein
VTRVPALRSTNICVIISWILAALIYCFVVAFFAAIRLVRDHAQNYIFQHVFANSIVAAFLGWQDSRNDRHEALRFGNMDKMPEDALQNIADFMQKHRVLYQWKKGDV